MDISTHIAERPGEKGSGYVSLNMHVNANILEGSKCDDD